MTSFLTGLVNTAFAALPAGTKAPVTFTRESLDLDESTNLTVTTKTTATTNGAAIANDVRRFATLGLVLLTPVTLLVAAGPLGSFEPTPGDTFIWGGKRYTIKDSITLNPDGESPLTYTVVGSL